MRLLILSDIHSNLEALTAVLENAKQYTYDKIACCGDLVGYGPNPNEVVEWAINEKSKGGIFVMGNHDVSISTDCDTSEYNPSARWAIDIHRKLVFEKNKVFLRALPYRFEIEKMMFIHGSPCYWSDYIFDEIEAKINFRYIRGNICFIGHTHHPNIYRDDNEVPKIVNVGSVGQPRDKDPRACYCIFDSITREVIINRCEYDIESVQKKMTDINMPEKLITRLAKGA